MAPHFAKLPQGVRRLFQLPQSRGRLIRDMDSEVEAHLAMRAEELRRLGMGEAEAWAEARRRFGDADEFRDYAARRAERRARRLGAARWLAEGAQDVRLALRQFRRAPALAAVVVLTLALCIGATTAVYGVARRLLLAPLPYPEGNGIVSVEVRNPTDGEFHFAMSAEPIRIWAARSRSITDFAAIDLIKRAKVGISGGRASDTMAVGMVTPSFLPLLRVRPALGRDFAPEDARGAPAVALLSDHVWRSRYGGDPGVIGRAITVEGRALTIVGVLPREVAAPRQLRDPLDVLIPLDFRSATVIEGGFARLRPGITSAVATRELESILQTFPDTGGLKGEHAEVRTPAEQLDPRQRSAVEVLFAAAAGLLLIGCADVAGVLLMRGWARRREFAIRRALGAWRSRLARQLLTESLLLATASGALGLLVAWIGLHAAVAVRPWTLGFLDAVRLDRATFLWTAATSLATALLFGIGPSLLAGRQPLDVALRMGTAESGRNDASARSHAALIVGQIALSLMFLSAAGVLARSFVALTHTPLGYDPAGLVEVSVRGATTRDAVARAIREALAATPGVSDVAVGTLPMTKMGPGVSAVEDPAGVRSVVEPATGMAYVSPEYFRVARIPLVRGRGFDASPAAAAGEVVINQTLARRLWSDRDALGARLRLDGGPDTQWLTVVGVAGNLRMPGAAAALYRLQMYRPASAASEPVGSFVLRTRGNSAALRPPLARAIERAGVGVTLRELTTADWTLSFAFDGPRFALIVFGAFAVLAVALAALGLFGIVAYAVARRTREIGVRVALGADPGALTRTILGQSMRLVAVGCGIGLLGAYGASRALTALVYGVSPTDPTALASAVALLLAVALAAAALPVRRALRVDLVDTLRAE